MHYRQLQKTCSWFHGRRVPPSNTKLTLANGTSTVETKTLMFQPRIQNGIDFLVSLYKSGLGYSAINTARSALSSLLVLEDEVKFGEHPLVARCMKGIFNLKPALPKLNLQKLGTLILCYVILRPAEPLSYLSLKQLTLNYVTVSRLDSADRPYISLMLATFKKWMTHTEYSTYVRETETK